MGLTGRAPLDLGGLMQPLRRCRGLMMSSLMILAAALPAVPANARDQSGLPVPRYVSLRSNQINLRSGPGMNFPIEWVYQRAWTWVHRYARSPKSTTCRWMR